jgi:hypothetical protein
VFTHWLSAASVPVTGEITKKAMTENMPRNFKVTSAEVEKATRLIRR